MSTALAAPPDYKFFDFLAPYRWPNETKRVIAHYRRLVDHGDLQIETILENALVNASDGMFTRVAEAARDFCDGSDAKKAVSQFRNNNIAKGAWNNAAALTGLKNKKGLIRGMVYSKYQDNFYFFAIPYKEYAGRNMIEIGMDRSIGYREPIGIPVGKWTRWQVESFERLATITPEEANKL